MIVWVAKGARERREAILQLADLRRRLAVAEDALAEGLAAMKAMVAGAPADTPALGR